MLRSLLLMLLLSLLTSITVLEANAQENTKSEDEVKVVYEVVNGIPVKADTWQCNSDLSDEDVIPPCKIYAVGKGSDGNTYMRHFIVRGGATLRGVQSLDRETIKLFIKQVDGRYLTAVGIVKGEGLDNEENSSGTWRMVLPHDAKTL